MRTHVELRFLLGALGVCFTMDVNSETVPLQENSKFRNQKKYVSCPFLFFRFFSVQKPVDKSLGNFCPWGLDFLFPITKEKN